MYPGAYSKDHPDKPAVIMAGTGEIVTYGQLEERSLRLAQLLHDRGLRPGDTYSVLMENVPRYFEAVWAGFRSGMYVTPINRYLTVDEAGYILEDSNSKALIISDAMATALPGLRERAPVCQTRLVIGADHDGYERYEDAIARYRAEPLGPEPAGRTMLYSSGTTGRPKGVRGPLPDKLVSEFVGHVPRLVKNLFEFDTSTVYLSPAPLYHSAPIGFTMSTQAWGGTVVVMDHFDPLDALRFIETYHVTHSQWVPTMFIRMLKLEDAERTKFDLSSHRYAVHSAAPCPRPIKEQMLDWWGPIIYEYYSGTESVGFCYATPEQWRSHPGTVGRAVNGIIHICDEAGKEVGPNETGLIYFERDRQVFEYNNDPEKTRSAFHADHPLWASFGDVGYVDEDGYLYLTDRATFMIVAGGVNIYPQEIEDVLVLHPAVADVAVIGVPNADLGEEVKAVVQLADDVVAGPEITQELLAYARERLARFKVPRSIDFVDEVPRLPSGKLYKRALRDQYWPKVESPTASKII
jgi:fatty-acyl-CoA synthase